MSGAIWLAVLGGVLVSAQAAINGRLGQSLQNPVLASLVSFIVGFTALAIYFLLGCSTFPDAGTVGKIPLWQWVGGAFGAFYVLSVVLLVPRYGVATVTGLAIAGQVLGSVVLDHFGWLGVPVQPLTAGRLVGIVLLGVGVWLVKRY